MIPWLWAPLALMAVIVVVGIVAVALLMEEWEP